MNKKKILLSIGKLILSGVIICLFIGAIVLILHFALGIEYADLKNKEYVQEMINSTGGYAAFVFVIISFLQVTFIPIPGAVTILAGNYLFGFWTSLLLSYVGMMIGSIFAFWLGRKIGRPFVNWVVGDQEVVEKYLNRLNGKETILLFFMFLLPLFPDDMLCTVAGITKLSYLKYFIIQIITRFTSIFGTLIFMSGEFIPYNFWGITLIVVLSILALIAFVFAYKNSDRINSYLDNISQKITSKIKK